MAHTSKGKTGPGFSVDFIISFFGQDSCLVGPDSSVADVYHCLGCAGLLLLLLGVSFEKASGSPAALCTLIPVYPVVCSTCSCGFASVSYTVQRGISLWTDAFVLLFSPQKSSTWQPGLCWGFSLKR